MSPADAALDTLSHHYLEVYPREAAGVLEDRPPAEAAELLGQVPPETGIAVLTGLTPDRAQEVLTHLHPPVRAALLAGLDPVQAARLLRELAPEVRESYLGELAPGTARELRALLVYPEDSAGRWMDPRLVGFTREMTAGQALERLRRQSAAAVAILYITDSEGVLSGQLDLRDIALAEPHRALGELAEAPPRPVSEFDPREELVERLEGQATASLPVVDYAGRLVGELRGSALVSAVQEDASTDLQAMVGASREERALSGVGFAVTRRLPWMEINLLTAFLAASVVGLFEATIAQFTALAVLLPVVAGQSGNAGAQALAITMRGLSLREITIRHWLRVVFKEIRVGLFNGLAIAVTTAAGVYVWSGSLGLSLVIAMAMVIAMVAAGVAGAIIPILLTRLGQDPAQASSILLTTVTDVVGFAAFLGIATLFAGFL